MTIDEFQKRIEKVYFKRDGTRGVDGTFLWFAEEVGELARAVRTGSKDDLEEEFADVFAWLVSLASLKGVRMETAIRKYSRGCPRCHETPCKCKKGRRPKGEGPRSKV